jgi:hypothetical protein
VAVIAWERIPAWRASDPAAFRTGLAHTLRRVAALRTRWLGGHLARSAVALAGFALAVVATAV